MNSPVRLGVSPTATTPTGFYNLRFWSFISPCWNTVLHSLFHFPVVSPGLSICKFGTAQCANCHLACLVLQPLPCCASFPPWLPISAPPTGLDECFFFNSLVVGLPYSLIFWQFWLFFVFKFVFLLLVMRGEVYLPMPPAFPEVTFHTSNLLVSIVVHVISPIKSRHLRHLTHCFLCLWCCVDTVSKYLPYFSPLFAYSGIKSGKKKLLIFASTQRLNIILRTCLIVEIA